ncbi:MAG: tRNA (adenosine(37)-N6)-threonylcarbamoyltransferase complex transferase subunit TsaD [Thermoguttaceae bacterium]|nr:tRNA (adenosine(37)-N6)-threonylcarbamoyltransferase complex transferase subunit TsaD [Thermoguttaceae bacterium]MDW8077979.1 tRNA (adenosine(37)-N6)-threonylcarbamoyltransferase complex transferase subunit TsaD [Thermoguttaceae bacterium]
MQTAREEVQADKSRRYLLCLETTCDETAAAVISDRLEVLGAVVASQDRLHERFGGIVPEIASRAHLERILPAIDTALKQAGIAATDLAAVAVAYTPGLAGSLMVGLMAAKTIALVLDVPLIGVDHLHAHVYACRLASGQEVFPCVGLVVSGGHTSLYWCPNPLEFQLIGSTIDDAAGEAFDKVASMLGLGYPGGPAVERAAASGNPKAYNFPRAFLDDPDRLDFSFSGIKTAVRYTICGPGKVDFSKLNLPPQMVADIAASFQEAVVDCLVGKAFLALEKLGASTLCVGGGVAANKRFRQRLEEEASRRNVRLYIAPLKLCTDNAVMGAIAWERYHAGLFEPLDLDIQAGPLRPKSLTGSGASRS